MATKAKKQSTPAPIDSTRPFSLISDAKLKQLYSAMLQCRMIDERSRSFFKRKPSSISEATAVGAAIDLRRGDWLASNDLFPVFLKGATLPSIFAQVSAAHIPRKEGRSPQANFDATALNVIASTQSPAARLNIAAGIALASKPGSIVIVFASGGAKFRETLPETMRFATAHTLPLLVVVPADLKAKKISSPHQQISDEVPSFPIIPVDASDVVAMYRVAYESIHKARIGGGPTLIEALCLAPPKTASKKISRLQESGPTHSSDPLEKMQAYLTAKRLFSADWRKDIADKFGRELDDAASTAQN